MAFRRRPTRSGRRRGRANRGTSPCRATDGRHRSTPCHSGVTQATGSQHVGQLGDREERAREQEHRHDAEPEQHGEAGVTLDGSPRRRRWARANARPVSTAAGRRGPPRASDGAEGDHHDDEDRGADRDAQRDEQQVAGEDVDRLAAAWRAWAWYVPRPLDAAHAPARSTRTPPSAWPPRPAARARGKRGSSTPPRLRPRAAGRPAPEPEAHGGEEQHRLEDARDAVPRQVRRCSEYARHECGSTRRQRRRGRCGHQSTSVRPVRRRKTSSRVLRRTRTTPGARPRPCTSATARRRRRRRAGRGRAAPRPARPSARRACSAIALAASSRRRSAARAPRASTYSPISCGGEPSADDAAAVHDDEPVAELLGLVHVVGGQHQRDALLLEPVQPVPQHVAGLRVEAGRRLVEQQQLGLVDQRPGDREPPLHAARQRLDPLVGPVAELHELEQLVGPLARPRPRAGRSSGRR